MQTDLLAKTCKLADLVAKIQTNIHRKQHKASDYLLYENLLEELRKDYLKKPFEEKFVLHIKDIKLRMEKVKQDYSDNLLVDQKTPACLSDRTSYEYEPLPYGGIYSTTDGQ